MCWVRSRGNYERCRDLLQEVSIALWLHMDKLEECVKPSQERAWVRWQTRSTLDHLHRGLQLPTLPLTPEVANTLRVEQDSVSDEEKEELFSLLGSDERRIMQLQMEGYRADEIAEVLGLKRDAVYQRMHRAVVKMRQVIQVVLLIAALSGIAVAVVPQWRKAVFGTKENVQENDVSVDEEVIIPKKVEVRKETPVTTEEATVEVLPRQSVERLPDIDVKQAFSQIIPDDVTPDGLDVKSLVPSIAVKDRRIIVSGANGEYVRVYDVNGKLLVSQESHGFCIINLFPSDNMFSVLWGGQYYVKIGNRPAVIVSF